VSEFPGPSPEALIMKAFIQFEEALVCRMMSHWDFARWGVPMIVQQRAPYRALELWDPRFAMETDIVGLARDGGSSNDLLVRAENHADETAPCAPRRALTALFEAAVTRRKILDWLDINERAASPAFPGIDLRADF